MFPQWVATEKNDDALLTNCICRNWKLEQKEKIEICTDVSVALTSCCGRLCALWEGPHASSGGGDLDHTLPLPSPHVLVHLVPGPEHGTGLLLLHELLTAGRGHWEFTTRRV